MELKFNGSFGLFVIEKVVKNNSFYELMFSNDKRRFAGCHLNSFVGENGETKNLTNLKSGDKIWIDISAYTADKSLYMHNTFGTKGWYHRVRKLNN